VTRLPRAAAHRVLLAGLLVLATGALVAGDSRPRAHEASLAAIGREVEQEADHVDAIELARWIRERRPGVRVFDVRSAAEFEGYRLPGAEHVALDQLARIPLAPADTVVLYSQGGAHAAQGWVLLRVRGHANAWFLAGGLDEWVAEVMEPRPPGDTSLAERERFREASELSRWLGGLPSPAGEASASWGNRSAVPLPAVRVPRDTTPRIYRRGC